MAAALEDREAHPMVAQVEVAQVEKPPMVEEEVLLLAQAFPSMLAREILPVNVEAA